MPHIVRYSDNLLYGDRNIARIDGTCQQKKLADHTNIDLLVISFAGGRSRSGPSDREPAGVFRLSAFERFHE